MKFATRQISPVPIFRLRRTYSKIAIGQLIAVLSFFSHTLVSRVLRMHISRPLVCLLAVQLSFVGTL